MARGLAVALIAVLVQGPAWCGEPFPIFSERTLTGQEQALIQSMTIDIQRSRKPAAPLLPPDSTQRPDVVPLVLNVRAIGRVDEFLAAVRSGSAPGPRPWSQPEQRLRAVLPEPFSASFAAIVQTAYPGGACQGMDPDRSVLLQVVLPGTDFFKRQRWTDEELRAMQMAMRREKERHRSATHPMAAVFRAYVYPGLLELEIEIAEIERSIVSKRRTSQAELPRPATVAPGSSPARTQAGVSTDPASVGSAVAARYASFRGVIEAYAAAMPIDTPAKRQEFADRFAAMFYEHPRDQLMYWFGHEAHDLLSKLDGSSQGEIADRRRALSRDLLVCLDGKIHSRMIGVLDYESLDGKITAYKTSVRWSSAQESDVLIYQNPLDFIVQGPERKAFRPELGELLFSLAARNSEAERMRAFAAGNGPSEGEVRINAQALVLAARKSTANFDKIRLAFPDDRFIQSGLTMLVLGSVP